MTVGTKRRTASPKLYEKVTHVFKYPKRIRPWQREGFSSKKEWSTMRKQIHNLIWKNREVA